MKYLLFTSLLIGSLQGIAQHKKAPDPAGSIDGIVGELLDLITLEKGEKADTAAVRNLFVPAARLTVLNHNDSSFAESVSLNEFLSLLIDPYYERGFREEEVNKVIDQYNGIAQVFQTFYAKDSEGVEEYGINSYQLVYYDGRWWIVSLLWTGSSNDVELPEKYSNH